MIPQLSPDCSSGTRVLWLQRMRNAETLYIVHNLCCGSPDTRSLDHGWYFESIGDE